MANDFKVYVVNFVATDPGKLERFEYYIKHSFDILGYWNYIPFSYFIKSRMAANQLMHNFFPVLGSGFIVAEVDVSNINGQLNQQAWEWFYAPAEHKQGGLLSLGAPGIQPGLRLGSIFGDGKT